MNALLLTLLVSLALVALGLVLFVHGVRQRDYDHADRLSLLPLEDAPIARPHSSSTVPQSPEADPECRA